MRAPRWASRPATGWLAGCLVLAAAVAAGSVAPVERTAPARSARGGGSDQVAVARASLVCPAPEQGDATATTLAVAAPGAAVEVLPGGAADGTDGAGTGGATVTSLDARTDLASMTGPGSLTYTSVAPAPGLAVRATGPAAPGLAASQLTRSTDATMRGLAGVSCSPTTTDAWFVGSGAAIGQRGRVYLTNLDAAPAIVDVTLYGPDGPIDAPDARGIGVPPGGQEVRLLDALAPDVERFAIHVRTRQGRVAAAVRDLQVSGLTPLGADWVPAAAAPARQVTVAGVPGGPGERLLQLVAPGAVDAIVQMRLVTPTGSVTPPGDDVIDVRAGEVTEVDLAPFTDGDPVTVVLESDVPVTAGALARVQGAEGQIGEIAYAAAGAPVTADRPGVVADVGLGTATTRTVTLTATGEAVNVRLLPLPPAVGAGRLVTVPAETLVTIDLATVTADVAAPVAVVPEEGSPPVFVTREVAEAEADGPFLTSSPVLPGRYTVRLPRVVADLRVGVPTVSRPSR